MHWGTSDSGKKSNADNMFLALKRGSNHLIGYKRDTRLVYNLELRNHLSFLLEGNFIRMSNGPFLKFVFTNGSEIGDYLFFQDDLSIL